MRDYWFLSALWYSLTCSRCHDIFFHINLIPVLIFFSQKHLPLHDFKICCFQNQTFNIDPQLELKTFLKGKPKWLTPVTPLSPQQPEQSSIISPYCRKGSILRGGIGWRGEAKEQAMQVTNDWVGKTGADSRGNKILIPTFPPTYCQGSSLQRAVNECSPPCDIPLPACTPGRLLSHILVI